MTRIYHVAHRGTNKPPYDVELNYQSAEIVPDDQEQAKYSHGDHNAIKKNIQKFCRLSATFAGPKIHPAGANISFEAKKVCHIESVTLQKTHTVLSFLGLNGVSRNGSKTSGTKIKEMFKIGRYSKGKKEGLDNSGLGG